jgi:hypothetical protein
MRRRYWIIFGAIALAIVAAGSAVAATKINSPSEQSKAIINDAAGRLHVSSSALSSALKQAFDDQIDAAVKTGRLTKQQGDALKARVDKGQAPLAGGLGFGFGFGFGFGGHRFVRPGGMFRARRPGGMFGAGFRTITSYLGITQAQLQSALASGKSLAQIAQGHDKTADGLVAALVAATKARLDKAVAAKHLTTAQEKAILARMQDFIKSAVNGTAPHPWSYGMPHHGFGFGSPHHFGGPPSGTHSSSQSSSFSPQL